MLKGTTGTTTSGKPNALDILICSIGESRRHEVEFDESAKTKHLKKWRPGYRERPVPEPLAPTPGHRDRSVPKPRVAKVPTESGLRGMKVVSLKRLAKNRGLKRYSKLRKDELINLLKPISAPRPKPANSPGAKATQLQKALKGYTKSFVLSADRSDHLSQLTATMDSLSSLLGSELQDRLPLHRHSQVRAAERELLYRASSRAAAC